jgi:aspartyl/glutamyl-tRNA(Asn/Gln) amidotransferase C subunit
MSNYKDIKELCAQSRLEIGEHEIQKTSEKIKEIILFFNKLDELELDIEQEKPYCDMKIEKKIDELREDINTLCIKNVDDGVEKEIPFNFLNKKNGYVIGPRV